MTKKVLILLMSLAVLGSFVFADTTEMQDFVYLFHLYYDNGNLIADRDFQFKYDVLPETFVPETLKSQFPYKAEVINLRDEIVATVKFDSWIGLPQFVKGKVSVKAPYAPDGKKVNFYDSQGSQLISIFVSESSFCNDDGVCNPDVGEDSKTCPNDCKETTPIPTVITESPGSGQGGVLMNLIYVLIIAGVGLGGWFGWKWWKSRQEPSQITQIPPDQQFPQNPNVQ